ncbi:hypothetical protein E3N88_35772 [Mikania micrantha]|uniref:Uncharacterized protein n=1 Tax=Mikania micrantha TaxID=192012 RepID=A0A5N6M287_9ASTR|nr:hypothetical protein E3N88_35772 [Mikania micrantha]
MLRSYVMEIKDDSMRKMRNMGENRVQNGDTDGPESQNEVSVEKWKKMVFAVRDGEVEGSPRYAMHENILDSSGFLRGTRSHFGFWSRTSPGTFLQVQINVLSVELRQIRISSLAPVASVPIAVRYQDNGDDMVRMHFT